MHTSKTTCTLTICKMIEDSSRTSIILRCIGGLTSIVEFQLFFDRSREFKKLVRMFSARHITSTEWTNVLYPLLIFFFKVNKIMINLLKMENNFIQNKKIRFVYLYNKNKKHKSVMSCV